jgi:ABC-2 type transport system permease protein
MTFWLLFRLSVGLLIRQRRTLLLVLLALLPVGLAFLYRIAADNSAEDDHDFAVGLLAHLILGLVLPLTALVVGTAAFGNELEDGTAVYLIAKPVPRRIIVLAKVAAAWLVIVVLMLPAVIATARLVGGNDDAGLLVAFSVAAVLGALAYAALFVGLSIRFGRALIIGLVYVIVWETLISQFVSGVRFLSVRAYITSLADALADSPSSLFGNTLSMTTALILLAVLAALSLWLGVRRLNRYEISERV